MDSLSPLRRSENMRRIRSRHTSPELAARKIVSSLGFQCSLHGRDLPGKPDLVFRTRKKAVFVHGCFWHLHGNCPDGRIPRSRRSYWKPKLERNVSRDRLNRRRLNRLGWRTLTVWECQIERRPESVARRLRRFLEVG
ncbi:MAG: DNA mismatch endonuclease Vsr [Deltaproteobacteria bacterium]|nr:DNA mismatch endonuclease Vsr [Deltaproteobacteria bacterium]